MLRRSDAAVAAVLMPQEKKQTRLGQHGSGAAWSPEDDQVLEMLLGEDDFSGAATQFADWTMEELQESLGDKPVVLPPAQGVPEITPPRPGGRLFALPLSPPAVVSPCPGSTLKLRPAALKKRLANLPPPQS